MAAKWRGDEYTNALRTRALLDADETTHGVSDEPMPEVAPPVREPIVVGGGPIE
jgi:hypothetical protein